MQRNAIHATISTMIVALALPASAEMQHRRAEPFLVPTFHCIGIYWSPAEGGAENRVLVKYRRRGQQQWHAGLPLRHHPVETPECKADYRGSLVNLTPGTTYDIALALEGTSRRVECQGTTWSEEFPVNSVVKVSDRDTTLSVSQPGRPNAYVLYDGTGCTIDTGNKDDIGIAVRASYVIVRGFTIRNVKEHGNGAGGLGGGSRIIKHCTTRNNILHVREEDRHSIAIDRRHAENDFDYDLTSAAFPEGHEQHGLKGVPRYVENAGFDPETKTGMFQLAPGSKGVNAGVVIPNFCEVINGNQPDLGAHESGTRQMRFGVRAQFAPLGTLETTRLQP